MKPVRDKGGLNSSIVTHCYLSHAVTAGYKTQWEVRQDSKHQRKQGHDAHVKRKVKLHIVCS